MQFRFHFLAERTLSNFSVATVNFYDARSPFFRITRRNRNQDADDITHGVEAGKPSRRLYTRCSALSRKKMGGFASVSKIGRWRETPRAKRIREQNSISLGARSPDEFIKAILHHDEETPTVWRRNRETRREKRARGGEKREGKSRKDR